MTFTRRHQFFWDIVAGSSALLAFWSYVILVKIYHGNLESSLQVPIVPSYLVLSLILLIIIGLTHDIKPNTARSWMFVSLSLGLFTRYRAVLLSNYGLALVASCALLWTASGFLLVMYASTTTWAGLRRVTAFIPWFVVLSPLAVGAWLAPPSVIWLQPPAARTASNIATVVLLFDEMNAGVAKGLQDILTRKGLTVSFKPVLPVHRSTTEVIPALFTGNDFEGARVCGVSSVCTEHSALAFDRIKVQRNDVDLVGFHHPYCQIAGLRNCQRLTIQGSIWNFNRWACALNSLFGTEALVSKKTCQEEAHQTWANLRDRSIEAVMDAPTLKTGGVLYAHLPLPHPPDRGAGSLTDQYMRLVNQTDSVLSKILDRLEENNLEPRILIFSDHPLRQSMWCRNEAAQVNQPCVVNPLLQDEHVPLIVSGRSDLPSIEHVLTNKEVFFVLREWLGK